jgi:predicted ATPase
MSLRRIVFVGASGTGKTACLQGANESAKLPVLPSQARALAKEMGFATPYDVDAVGRRGEYQRRLLEEKISTEKGQEIFISDRSVVDVLTYYAMHDPVKMDASLIDRTKEAFARYTHVFLCPMGAVFNPGDDPARVKNRGYHQIFQELCFAWTRKFHSHAGDVRVITLAMSSLEERIAYVRQVAGL